MRRSKAPPELGLPLMNTCNLEAEEELEFLTTPPVVTFRQPAAAEDTFAEGQVDRHTVPPAGHTLDST